MAKLEGRVKALENRGGSAFYPYHRIVQGVGQTQDEALEAYGRDKIGPNDNLVIRRLVQPEGRTENNQWKSMEADDASQ